MIQPTNVATLKGKIGTYAQSVVAAIAIVYTILAGLGIQLPGIGCPPCGEQPTIEAQ